MSNDMKCGRPGCPEQENRIDGYCSYYCRDIHDLQQENELLGQFLDLVRAAVDSRIGDEWLGRARRAITDYDDMYAMTELSPCCQASIITSDEYDEQHDYPPRTGMHSIWYVCSKCGKPIGDREK